MGSPADGTPRALGPIAREVLARVAFARKYRAEGKNVPLSDEDLRRIELCALATLDISMLASLYAVLPKEESCACSRCPCS